jgi:hypothetical protein
MGSPPNVTEGKIEGLTLQVCAHLATTHLFSKPITHNYQKVELLLQNTNYM